MLIWDEFLRHFRLCDEEDSGLSDEEQKRKRPKNSPKHTRKRIHQAKKNFLEKFKTVSEFEIEYTRNWGKMFDNITDPTYYSREKTIVRGNIPSRSSKTFTFYIPQVEDYKPYRITILRIRFANGNVKTINHR